MILLDKNSRPAIASGLTNDDVKITSSNSGTSTYSISIKADVGEAIKNDAPVIKLSVLSNKPQATVKSLTASPAIVTGRPVVNGTVDSPGVAKQNDHASFNLGSSLRQSGNELDSVSEQEDTEDPLPDNEIVVQNILLASARRRNELTQRMSQKILEKKVDVSSKVNNGIVSGLKNKPNDVDQLLGSEKIVRLAKNAQVSAQGVNYPVLGVPKRSQETIASVPMYKLIADNGIDPSSLAKRDKSNSAPTNALRGSSKTIQRRNVSETKNLAGLFTSRAVKQRNTNDLDQRAVVPVLSREIVRERSVNLSVPIPESALADRSKFHILMEVMQSKTEKNPNTGAMQTTTRVVQTLTQEINHFEKKTRRQIPMQPPNVVPVATFRPGRVSLSIEQNDEVAVKVKIYRKRVHLDKMNDERYEFVADVFVDKKSGATLFVDDRAPNSVHLAYRVIPVGPDETESFEFTNVIVKPVRSTSKKTVTKRNLDCTVLARPSLRGMLIEVISLPEDVIAIELRRRDLTKSERSFRRIPGIDTISLNVGSPAPNFEDTLVDDGHIYDYGVFLVYRDGFSELSTSTATVEFVRTNQKSSSTTIARLVTEYTSSGRPNVRFNIVPGSTKTEIDDVASTLREQGNDGFYETELNNNRHKLDTMQTYQVIRTDLTTGETQEFPFSNQTEFSDAAAGGSGLLVGRTYRYIVRVSERHPETLIANLKRTKVDENNRRAYTFKPGKFLNPLVLRRGTLLSLDVEKSYESSIVAKDKFGVGYTGEIVVADISIPAASPTITSVNAQIIEKGLVSVSWTTVGDMSKIDHFIVMMENLGQETVVGKAHLQKDTNAFEFIDKLEGELGSLTYVLIPVDNRYQYGTRVRSNELIVAD